MQRPYQYRPYHIRPNSKRPYPITSQPYTSQQITSLPIKSLPQRFYHTSLSRTPISTPIKPTYLSRNRYYQSNSKTNRSRQFSNTKCRFNHDTIIQFDYNQNRVCPNHTPRISNRFIACGRSVSKKEPYSCAQSTKPYSKNIQIRIRDSKAKLALMGMNHQPMLIHKALINNCYRIDILK